MVRAAVAHLPALVLTVIALGACQQPQRAGQNAIAKSLEGYGYSMYTPFRTSDLPGTIFVLSRNHKGKFTELAIANYKDTFKVPPSRLFPQEGQVVETYDELRQQFSVGGDLGAELLTVLVRAEASGKWSRTMTMRFADPKKIYTMTLARLAAVQDQLDESVKIALRDIKDRGQLQSVYVVLEALQVAGLEIDLVVKDEFKADVTADNIKEALKVTAAVESKGDGAFTIKATQPMLLGYKAITFPDSILRTEVRVGPLEGFEEPTAAELNRAKQ